ncbi:hypothetical protein CVT26_013855 [Gymnopilus dilepis]|uniref:Uncharacterized protein n=1 Tax=Gymnopilus dilepis TaxID=231916 RepID=A0A409VVY4_9AGAR|nr:hypothetical protein CVT26_013855 [Gymnopilus dilepis]
MRIVQSGENADQHSIGVSQTMNIFFNHPAPSALPVMLPTEYLTLHVTRGCKIRLVSRSISTQGDMGCCKCEASRPSLYNLLTLRQVWDVEKHRLVLTATQIQMMPSTGRKKTQAERANTQNLPVSNASCPYRRG